MRIEFTFSRNADYFRRQLLPAARLRTRVLRNAAWFVIAVGVALAAAYHEKAAGPVLGSGLVLAGVVALLVRRRWIVKMITVPHATITAVAHHVGYSSGFARSAAFKRVRGVSPQAHRTGVATPL